MKHFCAFLQPCQGLAIVHAFVISMWWSYMVEPYWSCWNNVPVMHVLLDWHPTQSKLIKSHTKTCTQKDANNRVDGQMEVQLGEAINPPGRLHFDGEDSSQGQMPKLLCSWPGTKNCKNPDTVSTTFHWHWVNSSAALVMCFLSTQFISWSLSETMATGFKVP